MGEATAREAPGGWKAQVIRSRDPRTNEPTHVHGLPGIYSTRDEAIAAAAATLVRPERGPATPSKAEVREAAIAEKVAEASPVVDEVSSGVRPFADMNVKELRAYVKSWDIKVDRKANKADLVAACEAQYAELVAAEDAAAAEGGE